MPVTKSIQKVTLKAAITNMGVFFASLSFLCCQAMVTTAAFLVLFLVAMRGVSEDFATGKYQFSF